MPLYEYQCQECGERAEHVQRFDDPPFTLCGSCGGALKKLFSAPAIQFKGSGFYLTDYGRSGNSPAKSSPTESKDKSGSTDTPASPSPTPSKSDD